MYKLQRKQCVYYKTLAALFTCSLNVALLTVIADFKLETAEMFRILYEKVTVQQMINYKNHFEAKIEVCKPKTFF